MPTPKPPAATIFTWLKDNLGQRCLAPLTSVDSAALKAAVQIVELYSLHPGPDVLTAFHRVVGSMQPHTRRLAYHAIAHVMDWSHRGEIWARAALPPVENAGRCKFE